ncbi:helix-turn-helix domain-containing protein [Paracoccus yeei]|uniref:helix-turn-helix domain-containing protein n=1 Tax=Paracoccus yeei TaxID=147645 RepID=UPI001CD73DEA|nr:helix-turn-helix transcriptional regulator [Paracoccus yeei]
MMLTGKDLAALRRRAGLSQAALAQRVGISRQTVSYWEGKPALDGRAATLTKIACALDPGDREVILSSRAGLGFISLHFQGAVLSEHLSLIGTAQAQRKIVLASMWRQTCKAMTRRGMECLLKSEPGKRRCRLHGGLSTGPKTDEGKARIAKAQRKRWVERRKAKETPENT